MKKFEIVLKWQRHCITGLPVNAVIQVYTFNHCLYENFENFVLNHFAHENDSEMNLIVTSSSDIPPAKAVRLRIHDEIDAKTGQGIWDGDLIYKTDQGEDVWICKKVLLNLFETIPSILCFYKP